MPYRRKPRGQRKHSKPRIPERILKTFSPAKRARIKFGLVPKSIKKPFKDEPLTRKLAASSKKHRDDGISAVGKLLSNSENEMDKDKMSQLWKALFYSFWMSDKTLIQQELARKLSNFVKICHSDSTALLYIECFMECMEREWRGIDHHRIEKYLSLVRYFVHSCFDLFALNEWRLDLCKSFSDILRFKMNLVSSASRGLFLHLTDVYIEELVKVNRIDSDDHLSESFRPPISFDALYHLLTPFISIYLESNQLHQRQHVVQKIFNPLLESMTFDTEQREINLHRPGMDDVDLYTKRRWKKKKRSKKISEETETSTTTKMIEVNGKEYIPSSEIKNFWDDSMEDVDAHNPTRRRKKQTPIMFDKKNFDVVMPFKEYEGGRDAKKVKEWKVKFRGTMKERLSDPLLLKHKMKAFQKVFGYMAECEETPNKAKGKLSVLAKMFCLDRKGEKFYDREQLREAIRIVDDRKRRHYWSQKKRFRKKRMLRLLKQQSLWRKAMKKGMKVKPTNKLIKRAARMIV